MSPAPIRYDGASLDLSARLYKSATVAASPAAATETIIATLTCTDDVSCQECVIVMASCAFTVGTDGTAAALRIRKTDVSGTVLFSTGLTTTGGLAATQLTALSALGFDTSPTLPGQVYVATLTITAGSAASTVSAVDLVALVI